MRHRKRAHVLHGRRVEHDHVGHVAHFQYAAVGEPEPRGRHLRHLVDRSLERQQLLIAHVLAQHAGECAVRPRMRVSVSGARNASIARDHRERRHHDAAHVLLVEHMIDRIAAAVEHRFEHQRGTVLRRGRQRTTRSPVFQCFPFESLVPWHAGELHARQVTTAAIIHDVVDDTARDAVLERGNAQALAEFCITTGHRPTGHQHPDARVRGSIWILIHHHVGAGLPRTVDHRQRNRALAPHLLTNGLVMREHHRHVCPTPDLQRLGHSIQQPNAFLSQMRRVHAAAVARHLRQRDHFLDVRVGTGQI